MHLSLFHLRWCKSLHPVTGNIWKVYPMYDFAHPIADALEGVSHSLCTNEFVDHRPLYEWVLEHLEGYARFFFLFSNDHDFLL
jgi:glutaminyl-tRNA synthetase